MTSGDRTGRCRTGRCRTGQCIADRRGFTLVELLVALGCFALLALAGTAILAQTVETRSRTAERQADLARLQIARALLSADLLQVTARAVNTGDAPGGSRVSFAGPAPEDDTLLWFTRAIVDAGRSGPAAVDTQAVRYAYRDGALVRIARTSLNDAQSEAPARPLLELAAPPRIRFLGRQGWQDRWFGDGSVTSPLPGAVELILDTRSEGTVRMVLLVGLGA